jgi:hypothetical protein
VGIEKRNVSKLESDSVGGEGRNNVDNVSTLSNLVKCIFVSPMCC